MAETFDSCWGHPNQSHEYHTHQSPSCVYDQTDSLNHSPIIGFAFDGFPIYGCYAYTNVNGTGPVKRMAPSYRMRNIADRTTLPNGTILSPLYYGPDLTDVPLGGYQEDFEYVPGLGDLDDHNGRFCITPEYPLGTYAYFVTLDSTLTPVYPYAIGQTFYGTIIPSDGNMGPNSGFVNITETVTNYVPSSSGLFEVETQMELQLFPNPASEQISFILKSNDFDSKLKGYLFNETAELLMSGEVSTNRYYAFDVSKYAPGIYFLKITDGAKTYNKRFVVSR